MASISPRLGTTIRVTLAIITRSVIPARARTCCTWMATWSPSRPTTCRVAEDTTGECSGITRLRDPQLAVQQSASSPSITVHESAVRFPIPLTPALFCRERENRRQSIRRKKPRSPDTQGTIPPLPAGEGRGEGPVHGPNARQKGVVATYGDSHPDFDRVCCVRADL